MQWLTRRTRLGILIGVALLLLAGLAWGAFQPWTANHFGYALPGQDHLPFRISYGGRDYSNAHECAGADWCQPDSKRCMSRQDLADQLLWPLSQVSSIPTLLGAAYPVFAPPNGPQTLLFMAASSTCYLTYELEGGP